MKKKKSTFLATSLSVGALALLSSAGSAHASHLFAEGENQLGVLFSQELSGFDLVRVDPVGTGENQGLGIQPGALPLTLNYDPTAGGAPGAGNTIISGNANTGGPGFTLCNSGGVFSTFCEADTFDIVFPSGISPHIEVYSLGGPMGPAGTLVYTMTLDGATIDDPTGGGSIFKPIDDGVAGGPSLLSCQTNPAQIGCAFSYDFFAEGVLTVVTPPPGFAEKAGETFDVSFSYNAARLLVENPSGDCSLIDGTCEMDLDLTTASGTVLLVKSTPESSNILALGALGLFGLFGFKRNSKKGL